MHAITFTRDPVVSGLVLRHNGDQTAPKLSASELAPELREIALDATTLSDYVGKYQLNCGAVIDFVLKGSHLES